MRRYRVVLFPIAAIGILLALAFTIVAGSNSLAKQAAPNQQKAKVSMPPPKHVDRPHVLAATYYNLNDKLTATLMLSNQGPHPMEVRVILFNLAGERLEASTVTLTGNTAYGFDLRKWVQAGGDSFHEGSLQVHYVGMPFELGGVVKLVDAEHSLIFDEELTEPAAKFSSSRLEGVWWLRSPKTELRVAVSNTTDAALTAMFTATVRKTTSSKYAQREKGSSRRL